MITILREVLRAESLGIWDLHLNMIRNILPIFAAAGHDNYVKSAYLYLQKMMQLESDHPDVYLAFKRGNFVIRRSNRYWGGLSTDLIIEQVLMRSLKSTGGLTRGTGLNELQRALWVMSMPTCSSYNLAMQELTNVVYKTSKQHKSLSHSTIEKDKNDVQKVLDYMITISPYTEDEALKNIVTGVVADESVNVVLFQTNGEELIKKMEGKGKTYLIRRLEEVKNVKQWDENLLLQLLTILTFQLIRPYYFKVIQVN